MLALIAGQGRLPELLAETVRGQGRGLIYCVFEGTEEGEIAPDLQFRLETLGTLLKQLKKRGATEVCFAGGVTRPKLDPKKLDLLTMTLVPKVLIAMGKGDDGALRMVLDLFESRGMKIRPPHEIMPELLPPAGVLSTVAPDDHDRKDAARAEDIVRALGAADVGQGCVVARRQALALEGMPGTDWMLRSLIGRRDGLPEGGTLYKAPKITQDRRIDLPTIGPDTLRCAAEAGLKGVAISSGGVMVLDRQETVAAADEAGLFLWVRTEGET